MRTDEMMAHAREYDRLMQREERIQVQREAAEAKVAAKVAK